MWSSIKKKIVLHDEKGWNRLQRVVAKGKTESTDDREKFILVETLLKSRKFDAKVLTSSSQTLLHLLCHRPFDDRHRDSDRYVISQFDSDWNVIYQRESSKNDRRQTDSKDDKYQSDSDEDYSNHCYSDKDVCDLVRFADKDESRCFQKQEYRIARLLLKNGVDFNHKDKDGKTALMLACENGLTSVVYALTKLKSCKLHVEAVDSSGETALTIAARNKNANAFNFLNSALFLRYIRTLNRTFLKRFLDNSRKECSGCFDAMCLRPFFKRIPLNLVTSDAKRPSGSCITFSDWFKAVYLAEVIKSEVVEIGGNDDMESKCKTISHLLLEFEKIVCAVTGDGWTALHSALFKCHQRQSGFVRMDPVEILLESRRLDVSALTNQAETVLHFVGPCTKFNKYDLEKIMWTIMSQKVNVNQRNVRGQTALMVACENGNADAVRELLKWNEANDYELDINGEDLDGRTALSIAKQSKNVEIIRVIEQQFFAIAAKNGDLETVKLILSLSNDKLDSREKVSPGERQVEKAGENDDKTTVEFQSLMKNSIGFSDWMEAIRMAYRKYHNNILNLLLNDDCFIGRFIKDGETLLHFTIKSYLHAYRKNYVYSKFNELEGIEILLKLKCDVNTLNTSRETVLHMCCNINSEFKGFFNIYRAFDYLSRLLETLLERKIDVNRRNKLGKTALMLAFENRNHKIVKELLDISRKKRIHLDIDTSMTSTCTYSLRNDSDCFRLIREEAFLRAVESEDKDAIKTFYTNKQECEINVSTWQEAVILADEKSSEDILRILVDVVVQREDENGNGILHRLLTFLKNKEKQLRSVEMLLEYGKSNVNAINVEGQTPLHKAFKYPTSITGYHDEPPLTDDIIKLFLRHGLNVNQKDGKGETLLAIASKKGFTSYIQTILKWSNETGAWLDLDAKDHYGRTALMNAAMWNHSSASELLLNAGASVNFSDNRGFTALHHALFGILDHDSYPIFGDFPKNIEELRKRKEIKVALSDIELIRFENSRIYLNELNENKVKTVELLLKTADLDVNALNFKGYSPLDLAEAMIPEIPFSIKHGLRQKGAILNIFQNEYQPAVVNMNFDVRDAAISRRLKKHNECPKANLVNECLVEPNKIIQEQDALARDEKGRTELHCAVINGSFNNKFKYWISYILKSHGCINEIDIYGHTPLHYATHSDFSLLLSYGADPSVKDIYGISSREMIRSEEYVIHNEIYRSGNPDLVRKIIQNARWRLRWCEHLNPRTIPEILHKLDGYAIKHPLSNEITKDVIDFIENLAREITRRDPRFEVRPILVGSSYEGTRIYASNEFDFNLVLAKFSQLCEVSQSPELPNGFVQLKRKQDERDERENKFDSFFDENGTLNIELINATCKMVFKTAMTDRQFIESQRKFDFKLDLMDYRKSPHKDEKLATTFKMNIMNLNQYGDSVKISIDIVPCIHFDGWWPDEAISNVSEDIKEFGCNLVFDRPQKLYPWVPYSKSFVRISFAPAESEMIKRSSDLAKQAYMIGKQIAKNSNSHDKIFELGYILKNSFLYCIEAIEPKYEKTTKLRSNENVLESNFNRMDRQLWLESLMKCYLDFIHRKFCPCYFMPKFSLPIRPIEDDKDYMQYDYASANLLYRCVSLNVTENIRQVLPHPMFEHFDRNAFVSDLSKSASKNIELKFEGELDDYCNPQFCDCFCNEIKHLLPDRD